MQALKHFLVCLDLTEMDDLLIRYAANLCNHLKAVDTVYFTHNIKFDYPEEAGAVLERLEKPLGDFVREALQEKITEHFRPERTDVRWELLLEENEYTPQAIIEKVKAYDIDLTVLGKKIRYEGSGMVGEKLLRQAGFTSSMLLVPETAPHQISNILVPIDFSRNATRALRLATELQHQTGARLSCQHVYSIPAHFFPYIPVKDMSEKMEKEARKEYREFTQSPQVPKVDCEFTFSRGSSISQAVYQHALNRHKDLIVIGSRGRSTLTTLLVGSIALQLFKLDLHLPLLIVRDL